MKAVGQIWGQALGTDLELKTTAPSMSSFRRPARALHNVVQSPTPLVTPAPELCPQFRPHPSQCWSP